MPARIPPDFLFETAARARGFAVIVGVDEVGRGPLAGPVTAAAVRLYPANIPPGLRDSKLLSAARRVVLHDLILSVADVGVAHASVAEIEALNISGASHLAMRRAIAGLSEPPDMALIDGNRMPPGLPCAAQIIVRGDARCLSIAAASIVAKVVRDRLMVDLAQHNPGYGWERNVGYPTAQHLRALAELGVTPHHRRHFRPVRNML